MKTVINKSKNTLFSLLLLCLVFPILSAFSPRNNIESTYGTDGERVEPKTKIINTPTGPKIRIHSDFIECIDTNQLSLTYSNKTNNSTPNGLMDLSMIECPQDTILNLDFLGCTASGELSIPTNIQGLCGGNEFNAETLEGGILNVMGSIENGDLSVFAQFLTPGTHHIQYMVNDSCDNVFACEFEVVVPPGSATVTLKQDVVVLLTSSSTNGESIITIYPENIDNGSNNPCSPVKLEIRKDVDLCGIPGNATYNADGHPQDGDPDSNSADYDPDGGQSVKFCCEDVINTLYDINGDGIIDIGYMKVWMRVWDDTNLDDILGNDGDSYIETWTFVKVENQLTPALICPTDVTITCDIDYTNLDITGSAVAYGSCGEIEVEYNDLFINLNACNEGFVKRRWNIVGKNDSFCDQTITVEDFEVPVIVSFSEVEDFTVTNCPDIISLGEPTWVAGPCDVLGYSVATDTFKFIDGACLKIINHFTVINWCDYKPEDPTWDGEGFWEHTQVVRVLEVTKPILDDCEDKIFAINDHTDIDNDGEFCEAMITLTNVAMDPGSENCPTDWLKWQVIVDLWGDGTNDLEYSSFLPSSDNEFNDTNGNGIPDIYLSPTNSGEEVNIQLPDIIGAFSNHKVIWKVVDGCNNVTTCSFDFNVKDQTPPTAACQDTVTVGLSQIGPTELWAVDYISDAVDNCSTSENLLYSFSANIYLPSYVLGFNNIANGFVQLPIYIWDETGNFSTCETVFIIDPSIILNTEETTEIQANLLHQNEPNPFRLSTNITFDLHQNTPVQLTFMNATSAKTLVIDLAGKKGLNTYALDRDMLSGQGLYYYTMTTKNTRETKKMILIH